MSRTSVKAIVHRQPMIDPSSSQAVVATPSSSSSGTMVATAIPSTSTNTSTQLRLRDFMPDEDAKNFGSAIWKTIDQTAFIRAQEDALQAFQVAKALKLSEETAAVERERRKASAVAVANTTQRQIMGAPVASSSASHPIPIKRGANTTTASDEAAARSLARSWRVDSLQPALLAKPSLALPSGSSPSSIPSSFAPSSSPVKSRSSPPSSNDTKNASGSMQKKPSQTIPSALPSSAAHASDLRHSRAPTTQPNPISYYSVPSSSTASAPPPKVQTQPQRPEPRSHSKREPSAGADEPTPSSSRAHISDVTNTKRRRTEPSPSISTSNQDAKMLLAPSMSESKKSSASARDVRQGRLMTPAKENSDAPLAGSDSRSRRRTIYEISSNTSNFGLLTATRTCAKCGKAVASPRGQFSVASDSSSSARTFAELLHLTCSGCQTSHCRGCFAVVQCPRACSGGQGSGDGSSCSVRNCCPSVHTIALFEALSSFDAVYATELGLSKLSATAGANKAHRQTFLKSLVTKTDKNLRKFEDAFVRTLRVLSSWLQGPVVEDGQLHPIVTRLFEASLLPEVIQAFLSSTNVRDWIAHSETYLAILDTLRRMFDCGLQQALTQPLNHIDRSCGLGEWVWDRGTITWQVDQLSGRVVQSMALCELVKQLESHRRPLMALAAKVQFPGTLEKVNALCDGISYLLLQQAVGIN